MLDFITGLIISKIKQIINKKLSNQFDKSNIIAVFLIRIIF